MTERLREEMLRVGDTAPPIHVPGDLWALGRRAHRRDRLVSGVVALSVIGLIFAVSMLGWPGLGGRADVAPVSPAGDEGAVPSTLYGVPVRFLSTDIDRYEVGASWSPKIAEPDLAVGRASVAFAVRWESQQTLPMVVTARDGAYHPLVLPGWSGASLMAYMNSASDIALALSPDGRSLAYPWWDPKAPLDGPMPAGIRVLSLETGDIREIPLLGEDGVYATNVSWSPDSRWLAWRGIASPNWTLQSTGGGDYVAGRVAPGGKVSESIPLPARRQSTSVAISNAGVVALFTPGKRWQTWDGGVVAEGKAGLPEADDAAAYSPDGTSVALSTRLDAYGTPEAGTSWFLDPSSGDLSERPLAEGLDLYPEGAEVHPLGWMDDDRVVAMVTTTQDGYSEADATARIVVMTAPSESRSEWTYRMLTGFDRSVSGPFAGYLSMPYSRTVTVAVDLMTLEHPTADFPPPDWPWSDERKALVIGLAVAAVLGCLLLGRRWLRRSRRTLR